jgi:hypothetical protein
MEQTTKERMVSFLSLECLLWRNPEARVLQLLPVKPDCILALYDYSYTNHVVKHSPTWGFPCISTEDPAFLEKTRDILATWKNYTVCILCSDSFQSSVLLQEVVQ